MSKKIKSIICCVCASLVLVVALCLPFAFKLNTKSTNYTSADEVSGDYVFTGSNLVSVYASTSGKNPLLSSTELTNYVGYVSFSFTQNSVTYKATTSLNNAGFPFSYNGPINNPSRVSEHWSPSSSLTFFEHVVNFTDFGRNIPSISNFVSYWFLNGICLLGSIQCHISIFIIINITLFFRFCEKSNRFATTTFD